MSKADELKAKNENLFERNTILLNENERLKKENAELKDKLNKIERKCKFNFVDLLHDVENESKQEEQLTKAKEIIKELVENFDTDYRAKGKAEQFIKEVEK